MLSLRISVLASEQCGSRERLERLDESRQRHAWHLKVAQRSGIGSDFERGMSSESRNVYRFLPAHGELSNCHFAPLIPRVPR